MAGWGDFFGGLGKLIEKGATYIPGRVERLKNERQKLLDERTLLLGGIANVKHSARMARITARLAALERLLADAARN